MEGESYVGVLLLYLVHGLKQEGEAGLKAPLLMVFNFSNHPSHRAIIAANKIPGQETA